MLLTAPRAVVRAGSGLYNPHLHLLLSQTIKQERIPFFSCQVWYRGRVMGVQFSAPRSLTHCRLRLRFCGKQGQSCADSRSSVIVRCVLLMLFLLSIHFLLSVCFSLSGDKRMRVHGELWKDGFLCARVPERKMEKGQGGLY